MKLTPKHKFGSKIKTYKNPSGTLPTAPKAIEVYKNGELNYVTRPAFTEGDDDLMITAPNGRTLQRKIVNNAWVVKPGEPLIVDTTYIETPEHSFWVTPEPRRASSQRVFHPKDGTVTFWKSSDADIMKRRWEEAMSVSKDKRKKK